MEAADGSDGSSLRLSGAEAHRAQASSGHEANHKGQAEDNSVGKFCLKGKATVVVAGKKETKKKDENRGERKFTC